MINNITLCTHVYIRIKCLFVAVTGVVLLGMNGTFDHSK
jgi:hypothetical protein